MKISSLVRFFSPQTSQQRANQAPHRPTLNLSAPLGNRQDVQLWSAQLPAALALVNELDAALPPSHLTKLGGVGRTSTRATTGDASFSLGGGTSSHPVQIKPGMGNQTGVALNAYELSRDSIVMGRPDNAASAAFGAMCLQKGVRAVFDLTSPDAPGRHCMKSNAPWVKGDTRVEFRCPLHNGFPVEHRAQFGDLQATRRDVGVRMEVGGKGLPPLRPQQPQPKWNNGAQPASSVLEWFQLPLEPGRAIPPRTLLALSQHAEVLGEGGDAACVFQSADGGRTAAMAAAAHDLYRLLKNPTRRDRPVMDSVTEVCLRGRARFSPDLFTAPEEVASLIGMARLMEQEGLLPRAIRAHA
ncbi:hypothetical protein [Roseateles terrae]|uniref:Uncharacterized protein n=1 Tax=Roseateles terrae TaxID=431060 RepID=A0ABR6GN64_9BURK|nr:hypothetical protein [Roseateles terrae]MBB3193545.1 hypothetical protein [Roseateles terrae]OWQ89285.1 hypothetical protein CDN98_01675 [Roseateles terrae]